MVTRIAVLGWGSLIWDRQNLKRSTGWFSDGPCLSVEFARVSSHSRATLVLVDDVVASRSLWARSSLDEMSKAAENLRLREGPTKPDWIYQTDSAGTRNILDEPIEGLSIDKVEEWLERRPDLSGVVWTGIEPDGFDLSLLEREVVAWLSKLLEKGEHARAEEYVRKAPSSIDTPVRRAIQEAFGWTLIPLESKFLESDQLSLPCS